jgi:trans-2,3-dihydro-3-hydroxyanthranilate isomerase
VRFYIVDVFAESKYSGNQLAVFRDAGKLSTSLMQQIAKEMHFSETTFITSEKERKGGYDVRIFTPDFELPFAGHPTLGTAYIIQTQILTEPTTTVKLNLKLGQIPVTFSFRKGKPNLLWMRQRTPTFGRKFEPRQVSPILGLSPSSVDARFPVMEVSTGVSFVIVPLKTLESVKKVLLDRDASERFLKDTDSIGFLVFSPETYGEENDLNVRVLGPSPSIPEDPATGSGNGCLAAYLVQNRYFGKVRIDIRVEQGYEIGRRSLLLLKAGIKDGNLEVNVGGEVQFIANGEFPDPP